MFDTTVSVKDESGESASWQIVGEDEADIREGRYLGKRTGESVEVQTPGAVKRCETLDVRCEQAPEAAT
ncbi:MAG: GreA/GreB family elongation factor [Dongiaceae bacterium]